MNGFRGSATVSGSFHEAMGALQTTVQELTDMGIRVLSPADPRVVDQFGEFLFVASDRLRNIRLVQKRHLAAIAVSDFLWLVAPDGYIGTSASMEIGFSIRTGIPILSDTPPTDLTLRQFVDVVPSVRYVMHYLESSRDITSPVSKPDVLVEPHSAIEAAHRHLEVIHENLLAPADPTDDTNVRSASEAISSILQHL